MNDSQIEALLQSKGLNAPRVTPDKLKDVIESAHFFTAYEGTQGNELERRRSESVEPITVQPITSTVEAGIQHQLGLLTFCVLVLKNGFTVTGESACASPENFDAEVGQDIAYKNALEKVWPLEGYLLKQKLYEDKQ